MTKWRRSQTFYTCEAQVQVSTQCLGGSQGEPETNTKTFYSFYNRGIEWRHEIIWEFILFLILFQIK